MRYLNPSVRNAMTAVLALSFLLPGSLFAKKDQTPADRAEAEKWITDSTRRMYQIDQLNSQYLLYSSGDKQYHFGIALARISSIQSGIIRDGYYTVSWQDYTHDSVDYMKFLTRGRAESFGAALGYLAIAARQQLQADQEASLQQFQAQAKTWREASPKPVMPESAREHQVLAEYAFKQRETEKAIREYQAAVAIFPTWPEGQFNLATLAGEQKDYDTAILHMREYLELVPDSPDVQAAKDSIIVWKDRLSSVLSASASVPEGRGHKRGLFLNAAKK
jgi:tetratricopeptide (TPR) repeat protein